MTDSEDRPTLPEALVVAAVLLAPVVLRAFVVARLYSTVAALTSLPALPWMIPVAAWFLFRAPLKVVSEKQVWMETKGHVFTSLVVLVLTVLA